MKHHYKDITEKLGQPCWWDEVGCPRYCEFKPDEVNNIYADEVVLLRISCQSCGWEFEAAMSSKEIQPVFGKSLSLAQQIKDKTICYGDPPNYGCCPAGPTMNSEPLHVLEFWRRDHIWQWERVLELEVNLDDR